MFFDQQSLLQQQLEIEDKLSEEKENHEKIVRSKKSSPIKSKRGSITTSSPTKKKTNTRASSSSVRERDADVEKSVEISEANILSKQDQNVQEKVAYTSVLKVVADSSNEVIRMGSFATKTSSAKARDMGLKSETSSSSFKPEIKPIIVHSRVSKKRRLEEQRAEQKKIQEERRRNFERQIELENLRQQQEQATPAEIPNPEDDDCTDEFATDDEEEEGKGDFSTEDEMVSEDEPVDNKQVPIFYNQGVSYLSTQAGDKQPTILQADSVEEEEQEEVKCDSAVNKHQIVDLLRTKSDNKNYDEHNETLARQKLAIFNKATVDKSQNIQQEIKTPLNKQILKPDQDENEVSAQEKRKLVLQTSDLSSDKKNGTESEFISFDNKKPSFKIPKVNLLQSVVLKRANDGPLQPPNLKRTRSIDGAKLRSITNIIPLQQKNNTQETAFKKVIKDDPQALQQKADQINLLNSVALAKKEQILQKKILGNKFTAGTNTAVAAPASANANSATSNTRSSNNNSLDSEKWKNSWRAVMADSKLITILKDPDMNMSSEEERLLSVVQAGFRSLGANITSSLDSKTFILVTVGELPEKKNFANILRLAERMNCKIWNMQKTKRFFKHLDIKVEEMEAEYDTMRFIDYAKYTIAVNYKLLEQTKNSQFHSTNQASKQQSNSGLVNGQSLNNANNNGGKLTEYLSIESKYGHLDRDASARREDHHYFADEKPHLYIYFQNQEFAPVVSMEWKCPTTIEDIYKEKSDVDSLPYPSIKYSYNGRSPFAKRDKEEVSYQRVYGLNKRRSSEETEDCLSKGHEISPNLVKQRYEKDASREDYALLIKRLYSQSSTPKPENDLYLLDKFYSAKLKKWAPYNNSLSKAHYSIYDEKRDASILNAHQETMQNNENQNTSANGTTAISHNQILKPITPPHNHENTTNQEDTLTLQTQNKNKEMRASGVYMPTNTGTGTGTGTGNGLAPVKASVVSTQMKLLQKRQIQQQKKVVNGLGKAGYCEGCRMKYDSLDKHMKSEKHRSYAVNKDNFAGIDALIANLGTNN